MIPDYSQPPPYSTQQQQQQQPAQEGKRRSHGGDSKYGFPNKQQGNGVAEEFPPPPPQAAPPQSSGYSSGNFRSSDRYGSLNPADGASPPDKRSQSQPATSVPQGKGKKEVPGPVLPPKIDRQKKPSKKSAAERLFGRGSEKEEKRDSKENSLTNGDPAGSDESPGGEKRSHGYDSMPPQESSKKNTYDSNSSGNFDSYNKHNEVPGYAYSRSISQPPAPAHYSGPRSVGAPPSSQGSGGAEKFRYSDYKPLPPPKSSIYKPVPPPKPKPFSRSNSQPPSMTEDVLLGLRANTGTMSVQSVCGAI